jgi:hypothetical protein
MRYILPSFAIVLAIFTSSANALVKLSIDSSVEPTLLSIQKRELVIYNEAHEIVYKFIGDDLDASLKKVLAGEKKYKLFSEEEWRSEELRLRPEVMQQIPKELPSETREKLLNQFIAKIKVTHTSPAIEYELIKKNYKNIESISENKKLLVVFLPKNDCISCDAGRLNAVDIEKKHPDFAVVEVMVK